MASASWANTGCAPPGRASVGGSVQDGPEDGRRTGRPRTDPRSSSTGPDLEGVGPVAPVTEERTAVADREAAAAHVAGAALRPGPVGPVGLELEAHLVDLDAPASRVPWQRIRDL